MIITPVDTSQGVFVIAEIGANHEGDLKRAFHLIRLAKKSGADAVKFQSYHPEKIVNATQTDRRAHFQRLALSENAFAEIANFCKSEDITFLSTPFDLDAIDMLESHGVPAYKIASGDFTFWPLIEKIVHLKKPILLSTGLATTAEITATIAHLNAIDPTIVHRLGILHCVTSYPTPPHEANLTMISQLCHQLPEVTIGYSDHTLGTLACTIAVGLGARIIEKHFTDDHHFSSFRDHALSATPDEFSEMVNAIRQTEVMCRSQGDVSASEHANLIPFRRSICAKLSLAAGTIITEEMVTCLRPQTGIPANAFFQVIGKKLAVSVESGHPISWNMLDPHPSK